MKCDFCGREAERGALECPYCHYRFRIDPQVLTPDERDTFEGVTIEEDGTASDAGERRAGGVTGRGGRAYGEDAFRQGGRAYGEDAFRQGGRAYGEDAFRQAPRVKVHTFGCGSGILLTLLVLGGIVALIAFLLPVFFVYALAGAVVVTLLKLFGGLF